MSSNSVTKALAFIAVAGLALLSALYYALTSQQGPDGHIVLGTGGLPHYQELALRYQSALEPYGVTLDLRPTSGGFTTLQGLVADPPEIDVGFIKGGLVGSMQGRLAWSKAQEWQQKELGKLRSVGRLFYEPIWVFVRADSPFQTLRDLKDKSVLTGTRASGTRSIAFQLLKANGIKVGKDNPLLIDGELSADGSELRAGLADAAFLIQPADADKIQKLLRAPGLRLMDFALEADAYANRFPALTKVVLDRGAVEFNPLIPAADVTLLATSVALVVRADLPQSLVSLLAFGVLNNPRSGFDPAGDPVLFHRPGLFPTITDPEYQVADGARMIFKSGELPIALRAIAPAVHSAGMPFSVTAFAADHGAQTVLLLIPSLVILLPLLRILPIVYSWSVRRRLLYWYRQLKVLEKELDGAPPSRGLAAHQAELERIDSGVRRIRYPLNFSDQFYQLRLHINLVRQRLIEKPHGVRIAAE